MSDIVIDKEQESAQQRAERYERYLKELQGKKDQKDTEQEYCYRMYMGYLFFHVPFFTIKINFSNIVTTIYLQMLQNALL